MWHCELMKNVGQCYWHHSVPAQLVPAAWQRSSPRSIMGRSWCKLRKLHRWLSLFGVSLDLESSMRCQISNELPFSLAADMVPVSKDGSVIPKSLIRYLEVQSLILHYLEQHKIAKPCHVMAVHCLRMKFGLNRR